MICKKHNWETQLIAPHKLGTVCTNCGILKIDFDMKNEKNKELINLTLDIENLSNEQKESIKTAGAITYDDITFVRKDIVGDWMVKFTEQKLKDEKEYHLNPMSAREYAEMYLGMTTQERIDYLTHLFEEYGKQFQKQEEPVDWKLIEKELKYLIDNYGVPENDYRGYPDADDIVRTVKYIIDHKK